MSRPAALTARVARHTRFSGLNASRASSVRSFGSVLGKSAMAGMPSRAACSALATTLSIGQPLDARHRGDGHALVGALDDEQRPDQVVDAEAMLGDEAARPARCDAPRRRRTLGKAPSADGASLRCRRVGAASGRFQMRYGLRGFMRRASGARDRHTHRNATPLARAVQAVRRKKVSRRFSCTFRSAMSTWKWLRCASLASGPSVVPKMRQAAAWASRRKRAPRAGRRRRAQIGLSAAVVSAPWRAGLRIFFSASAALSRGRRGGRPLPASCRRSGQDDGDLVDATDACRLDEAGCRACRANEAVAVGAGASLGAGLPSRRSVALCLDGFAPALARASPPWPWRRLPQRRCRGW